MEKNKVAPDVFLASCVLKSAVPEEFWEQETQSSRRNKAEKSDISFFIAKTFLTIFR